MIKGSIHQKDITVINTYILNNRIPKSKLTELKGKIDSATIKVGDYNTPLSIMDKTIRQKNNRK